MRGIWLGLLLPGLCGAALAVPQTAPQAPRPPHLSFVYPAGGRPGTTFEVTVGGDRLDGATAAILSGAGATVQVVSAPLLTAASSASPKKKAQAALGETVKLRITLAPDAEPEDRELCLVTPGGLSNKRVFQVGRLEEVLETESPGKGAMKLPALPVVVNGQILSGDVDAFSFPARKGQQLVAEVSARALIPFIADAVPGWFQAIVTLSDAKGKELAVADAFRFNQDPVLLCEIPADGEYRLSIRDSIYRGRQDFVYRIRLGELPFVSAIFPLGARRGEFPVAVRLTGKNLPLEFLTVAPDPAASSIRHLSVLRDGMASNRVPFAVGTLPEVFESDRPPQHVAPPVVVNGRIRKPGETDSFSFRGNKGQPLSVEVQARRLGSPLDSWILLLNDRGERIAGNDDMKGPAEGLLTHLADSALFCALPEDGTYTLKVFDTQGKGGEEYAYRLRIGSPVPDFELRVTPSELSLPTAGSAPLTVHVLRRDGFSGEIKLSFESPEPPGVSLDGATVPAGADRVRMTLSASGRAAGATLFPRLVGTATVGGKPLIRPALPAEEFMQAFIYPQLVPARAQVVVVTGTEGPFSAAFQLPAEGFLSIPRGKETALRVSVTRRAGFDGPIRLVLADPPKDVSLQRGTIPAGKDSAMVRVRAGGAAEPGGNLIVYGVMTLEKEETGGDKKKTVERLVAAFPALPFKIVGDHEKNRKN